MPPKASADYSPKGKTWLFIFWVILLLGSHAYYISIVNIESPLFTSDFEDVPGSSWKLTIRVSADDVAANPSILPDPSAASQGVLVNGLTNSNLDCTVSHINSWNIASYVFGTFIIGLSFALSVVFMCGGLKNAEFGGSLVAHRMVKGSGAVDAESLHHSSQSMVFRALFFVSVLLEIISVIFSSLARLFVPEILQCHGIANSFTINGSISTFIILVVLVLYWRLSWTNKYYQQNDGFVDEFELKNAEVVAVSK